MAATHTYAIFSAQYRPHAGGVELYTERLAHQLAAQGDRVIVVTSRLDGSPEHEVQDDGVEVYRLPCHALMGGRLPISRKNGRYGEIMGQLEREGIDRVLVNTRFYRHSLEGLRLATALGVPVMVLDHGSAHLTLGNAIADWFIERYEHAITRRGRKFRPAYAGVSLASARWLRHFGIDTVTVIPNAIDVGEFRALASERDFRRELCVDAGQRMVSFVGRLEPEKGALAFARAAASLGSGFVCVMAGDGSQRQAIEALGLDNLVLLGRVGQPDLSALLRDSDVFCLPTRSEGFCTSLLEAAAQACVPVMPRVGGTDEIMGCDPVRFGVLLEDAEPDHVAASVRQAAALVGQGEELAASVSQSSSWRDTALALDAAFSAIAP